MLEVLKSRKTLIPSPASSQVQGVYPRSLAPPGNVRREAEPLVENGARYELKPTESLINKVFSPSLRTAPPGNLF